MSKLLVSFYDWLIANPVAFEQGPGLFSPLHICLMVFLAVWLVAMFFVFKRFPKFTKYAILGMSIYILVPRVFRMILCVATGINTWLEVLPFHLCHIMSFLIPLCVFFKWKKPLPAFLFYAFFGGVLTFIFGDYYKYNMLTFLDIESIILHIILPTITIAFIAIKQVNLTIRDMIIIPIMLLLLACWAEVGNTLLGTNYMYIRENGLPVNFFPGLHFLWSYTFLLVIILASIYIPVLVLHHKKKKQAVVEEVSKLKDKENIKNEKNAEHEKIEKDIKDIKIESEVSKKPSTPKKAKPKTKKEKPNGKTK